MITYKKCSEASIEEIYEAFKKGFSDYILPMNIDKAQFESRFFGPEGNSLAQSYLAVDDDVSIGLALGGIRDFDGLKTLRCGTLCIDPNYRGKGIGEQLMQLHMQAALAENCKQLFLEVIKSNAGAIRFYEKLGYKIVYELKYYSTDATQLQTALSQLGSKKPSEYTVALATFDTIESLRRQLADVHINWQSDTPYYAGSETEAFYHTQIDGHTLGAIARTAAGKINFLYVLPEYRHKGIGSRLLMAALEHYTNEKVSICLPNNSHMEGFIRKLGFKQDALGQYEMYKPL